MGLPFVASGLDGKPGKAGSYGRVARSRAIPHDTRRIEFRKMAGAEKQRSEGGIGSRAQRTSDFLPGPGLDRFGARARRRMRGLYVEFQKSRHGRGSSASRSAGVGMKAGA